MGGRFSKKQRGRPPLGSSRQGFCKEEYSRSSRARERQRANINEIQQCSAQPPNLNYFDTTNTYKALRKAYILCGCLKSPGMAFFKFDVLFAFHAQAAFHTQAWARHVQADPREGFALCHSFPCWGSTRSRALTSRLTEETISEASEGNVPNIPPPLFELSVGPVHIQSVHEPVQHLNELYMN